MNPSSLPEPHWARLSQSGSQMQRDGGYRGKKKEKTSLRYLIEPAFSGPVNDTEEAQEEDGLQRQSTSHLSV